MTTKETPMIAGCNRAGWRVIAALALTGTAGAQARPAAPPAPATPALAAPAVAQADSPEARARLSEIKVGIAWLADPATFACSLKLRTLRSTMLEVSGIVPSPEIRTKALELARACSDLSVVDALAVGKVSPPKRMKESATRLNLQATNALAEQPFPAIKGLEIQAHPDGKITLLGSISSHEDKLLASLRLRRITGCTCVDNCLSIQPLSGTSCYAVTADGRLTVHAERPEPTPSKVASAEPAAPKAPVPVPRLSKDTSAPVKIVPASAVARPAAQAHVDPAVMRAVFEMKPAAGFVVQPVSAVMETSSCTGAATACEPTKLPGMKCALPVGTAPVAAPSTAVVSAEPHKVQPAPSGVAEMPRIVATAGGLEFRAAGTKSAEAPAAKPAAPNPAVADTDAPLSAVAPPAGSLGDWYRNRIAQECDLDLECVGVTFPTHTDIAVTLRIADRASAGRVCMKVSRIPELAPYHVKLEVETPPR
jgi:hypothetical protein